MAKSKNRSLFNEATRVQMPALVHLTRIGYSYFGKITEDMAGSIYDPDTNILINVFKEQFAKLNPDRAGDAETMLRTIRQELDNDDIGESFYKRLKAVSPVRLIDFEHPSNNTYHCTAEFTCKRDEDEFRPDITLFINGLPLVFIEVKKPNNIGGMVAEAERMNKQRFPNKKFRRFINITQLKCASNQQINSITNISEDYNPFYLYYWLCTKKEYLFSIASVTRTPILSKGVFEEIEIPEIKREDQDKVADVLLAIDKKIEANTAINDNLQQMAHTAYMHLFFNKPANGRISDILIENSKSSIQVGEAKDVDGDYPFFTSGDAVLCWPEFLVDGRNCYLNTGGNAGVKYYVGKAAYSTDTWCISAREGLADYLYLLLDSIKQELSQKYFQGTGLKHLQKPMLKDRPIYIPSSTELESFNQSVVPWLTLISDNIKESQRLTLLRDWLLPMLMNGQATITD